MEAKPVPTPPGPDIELERARAVVSRESDALAALAGSLTPDVVRAVDLICACADTGGTVLVTGLGKSGHIAAKISATLASLAIPSHFIHPAEAAHGDLGRFTPKDLAIAISHSGTTEPVVELAAHLHADNLPIISITSSAGSPLEKLSACALHTLVEREADADLPAPTCSTTATLALGDALALTAAYRRATTHADFHKRHPAGALGGLLRPVTSVLRFRIGENLAAIPHDRTLRQALLEADRHARRPGAILLTDPSSGALTGIFTDADLRRLVLADPSRLDAVAESLMTRQPTTLPDTALVRDARVLIARSRQDEIPVVDDDNKPIGLLDVQDLIAMKLVQSDEA